MRPNATVTTSRIVCKACGVTTHNADTLICNRCALAAEIPPPDDRDWTATAHRFYDRRRPIFLDDGSWDASPQWVHDEKRALIREVVGHLEATGWKVVRSADPA